MRHWTVLVPLINGLPGRVERLQVIMGGVVRDGEQSRFFSFYLQKTAKVVL